MADVLFHFKDKSSDKIVSQYNLKKEEYYLLTLHRPASVDNIEMLDWMIKQVIAINEKIIFPGYPR